MKNKYTITVQVDVENDLWRDDAVEEFVKNLFKNVSLEEYSTTGLKMKFKTLPFTLELERN